MRLPCPILLHSNILFAGKYITNQNTGTDYNPFRTGKYQFGIKKAKVLINAKIVFVSQVE